MYIGTYEDIEQREFPVDFVCKVYNFRAKVEMTVFNKVFPELNYLNQMDGEIGRIRKLFGSNISFDKKCVICRKNTRQCVLTNQSSLRQGTPFDYLLDYTKCKGEREIKNGGNQWDKSIGA